MARPGHLYVMDAGDGRVKVGFAKNPQARSKVFKGAAVLHISQWDDRAELIEKAAHRLLKLAGTHIENEIFSASVDEAINAINQAFALAMRGELPLPREVVRLKKLLSVYIDPELLARLEEWLAGQEFPPTKTAAVEAALREFLDRRERQRKRQD